MKAFEPYTYVLLRIVTGFLFFWHGTQKIFGWPPSGYTPEPHIVWIAGGIELVGGLLICIGLFTRPTAFLCSGARRSLLLPLPVHLGPRQRQAQHRPRPRECEEELKRGCS